MAAKAKPKAKAKPSSQGPLDTTQVAAFDHDRELVFARFSPCGKFIFAGSYDSNVYRWDVGGTGKTTFAGHHGWIQGLAFHPDGKRVFTADSWGGICGWNYADAAPKALWKRENGHANWMRAMALSADGTLLATCGSDFVFRIWSTQDGSLKWESPVQENDLFSVQFHPTSGALVVGDVKGNVAHWDVAAHKLLRTMDAKILYLRPVEQGVPEINDVGGIRSLAFDAAGKTLACAGTQPVTSGFLTGKPTIVLIDWESGKQIKTLQWENAEPSEGITMDVSWHPEGYVMAASSGQPGKGALYFWKPQEKAPFYIDKTFAACRSVSTRIEPDAVRIAVTQVHSANGEGGNGRKLSKDGDYFGFQGQVRLFEKAMG